MRKTTQHSIRLGNRRVAYRLAQSRTARRLRVRVGPSGVDVIQPAARPRMTVNDFLRSNQAWLLSQLDRVARLGEVRRTAKNGANGILYRGVATPVRIEAITLKRRENRVAHVNGEIVLQRGPASLTPLARSLETWLRREARTEIKNQLALATAKVKRTPNRIYIMDQRTKWGNCSRKRNLSFNWRLILAPDFVLRYIVNHEAVHLAVPDHSARFWLTLQSHYPDAERAKRWLAENAESLHRDLRQVFQAH